MHRWMTWRSWTAPRLIRHSTRIMRTSIGCGKCGRLPADAGIASTLRMRMIIRLRSSSSSTRIRGSFPSKASQVLDVDNLRYNYQQVVNPRISRRRRHGQLLKGNKVTIFSIKPLTFRVWRADPSGHSEEVC